MSNIASYSSKPLVLVLSTFFIIFIFIAVFGIFLIFFHASIVGFLIVIKASGTRNSTVYIRVSISFLFFNWIIIFVFVIFTIILLVIFLYFMIIIVRFIIRLATTRAYTINHLVGLSLMNGSSSFNSNLIVATAFMILINLIIIEAIVENLGR